MALLLKLVSCVVLIEATAHSNNLGIYLQQILRHIENSVIQQQSSTAKKRIHDSIQNISTIAFIDCN
jgi:hypothetical protein